MHELKGREEERTVLVEAVVKKVGVVFDLERDNLKRHDLVARLLLDIKPLNRFVVSLEVEQRVHKQVHAILTHDDQQLSCRVHLELLNWPRLLNLDIRLRTNIGLDDDLVLKVSSVALLGGG